MPDKHGENTGTLGGMFGRAVLWNHSGKLTEYALTYLFSVLLARKLGAEQNGGLATYLAVAQLLIVLSSAGTDAAINRYLPQIADEGSASFVIRRLFAYKGMLFAFFGLIMIAGWHSFISWFGLQAVSIQYGCVLLAFAFARIFSSSFTAIWLARFSPRPVYYISNAVLICQIIWVQAVIGVHAPMQDALPPIVFGAIAVLALNALLGRRYLLAAETSSEPPPAMKPVRSYSAWLWMNAMLEYVLGKQGDIALLGFFAVAKTGIGQYDAAHSLSQLPGFALSAGFAGVSISMFAKLAHESKEALLPFWKKLSRLLTQLTVPMYCFAFVFAPDIIRAVYSTEFLGGTLALQILAASRIAARLFGGGENTEAVLALNGERAVFSLSAVGGALNLILNIGLIPIWGIAGAATATGVTTVLVNMGSWNLLHRNIGNPLMAGHWLKVFLIGILPPLGLRVPMPALSLTGLIAAGIACAALWAPSIYFIRMRYEDRDVGPALS
jgi:O-antigen/teichoic acid export membrane protein